jgi:hypothetical protein
VADHSVVKYEMPAPISFFTSFGVDPDVDLPVPVLMAKHAIDKQV